MKTLLLVRVLLATFCIAPSAAGDADVPTNVVIDKLRVFQEAYNTNDLDKATSIYASNCSVTVGNDCSSPFTANTPQEFAGFLGILRNQMGGTNIKLALTKVDGTLHDVTWVTDNSSGWNNATWEQIDGEWMIAKNIIKLTPSVHASDTTGPPGVVIEKMRMFQDAYNANDMDKASSVYASQCNVTVNGGVEKGGPFTGHTPQDVAGFLDNLRNKMGGTHIKFAVTNVDQFERDGDWVHDDVWVADNGAGSCTATWKKFGDEWLITSDDIQFVPNVTPPPPLEVSV